MFSNEFHKQLGNITGSYIVFVHPTAGQIHQARQFLAKPENTVHSNVTAEPSTLAVSRNALKNIPKAPFQSLSIE